MNSFRFTVNIHFYSIFFAYCVIWYVLPCLFVVVASTVFCVFIVAVAESSPGGHEDTYSRLEHSEQTFGLKKSVSDTVVPNNKLGNRPGRMSTTRYLQTSSRID